MLGIPIKRRQITDISGIGELVEVDDPLPHGAPGQHIAGTDKPRASGYKNCLHSDTFQTDLGNTSNARNGLIAGMMEEFSPDNAPHPALDFFGIPRRSPNTNRLRPKGYEATRTGHTGGICVQP